jgi:NAD(P)-dependent dehydrogenase (short-subunit alcohol dehydrogenase family)
LPRKARTSSSRTSRRRAREETGDDLIGTVLRLCSDLSAFVTGQSINVDGGSTLH